jgi:hypothetical protein
MDIKTASLEDLNWYRAWLEEDLKSWKDMSPIDYAYQLMVSGITQQQLDDLQEYQRGRLIEIDNELLLRKQ